jgi:hypothetical protein
MSNPGIAAAPAAASTAAARAEEAAHKPRLVGRSASGVLVAVVLVLSGIAVYAIYALWPVASVGQTAQLTRHVSIFGWSGTVTTERLLFAIVAVSGSLGGFLHVLRSLGWYVGWRKLAWNWVPYYFVIPLIGAALAVVFYIIVRGGFFTINAGTGEVNPYGFAALGALVGLFSQQALEALKNVAEVVFTKAPKGRDQAPQTNGDTQAGQTDGQDG